MKSKRKKSIKVILAGLLIIALIQLLIGHPLFTFNNFKHDIENNPLEYNWKTAQAQSYIVLNDQYGYYTLINDTRINLEHYSSDSPSKNLVI